MTFYESSKTKEINLQCVQQINEVQMFMHHFGNYPNIVYQSSQPGLERFDEAYKNTTERGALDIISNMIRKLIDSCMRRGRDGDELIIADCSFLDCYPFRVSCISKFSGVHIECQKSYIQWNEKMERIIMLESFDSALASDNYRLPRIGHRVSSNAVRRISVWTFRMYIRSNAQGVQC